MRIFNGERIQKIMTTLRVDENEPITARMVSRAIENAQKRVEGHNFDIRKHLIDYDDVMNQQRTAIYTLRRQILAGEDIERKILDMLSDVTSGLLDTFIPEDGKRENWNLSGLVTNAQRLFGISLDAEQLQRMTATQITELIGVEVKRAYDRQKSEIGGFFEQLARMLLLQTIDQRWKEHLERIDRLKEGIHLRAHAQLDPLIEYKKEAFKTFEEVNRWIKEETLEKLLKIKLVSQDRAREVLEERQELNESGLSYAGADENPAAFSGSPQPRASAGNGGGGSGGGLPFAQPQQGPMEYSYGPDMGEDGPRLNREQRRRMDKKAKKKKVRI
jgi:preprotein translocase subunit SecA